jgi:hypothetical protein
MWGLAMLLAAASVSFGAFASAAQLFGTEVEVTVLGCDSEVLGRTTELTTFCEVSLGAPGPKRVEDVQVDREYATGAVVELVSFGGTVTDPELNGGNGWFGPVGLAIAGAAWWMGFPPRASASYGKHAQGRQPT